MIIDCIMIDTHTQMSENDYRTHFEQKHSCKHFFYVKEMFYLERKSDPLWS